MTNWLYRILLVAIIAFCFAASFRLLSGPVQINLISNEAAEQPEQQAQGDGSGPGLLGDYPNWGQFVVAALMAWFSYCLLVLGRKQTLLLMRANRTARHALNEARKAFGQTKRSVDAYVAKERALMKLNGCVITDSLNGPGRKGLLCSYQNIGSGTTTARFFGVVYRELNWLEQPDWNFPTEQDLNTVVHSRDPLVVDHNRVGVHMLIPKEFMNEDGSVKSLYAFIKITYETLGVRRCYYTTWMHWVTLTGPVDGVWTAYDLDIEIESEVAERKLRAANAEAAAKAREKKARGN